MASKRLAQNFVQSDLIIIFPDLGTCCHMIQRKLSHRCNTNVKKNNKRLQQTYENKK